MTEATTLAPLTRARRDIINSAKAGMSASQARYLVDLYYTVQDYRIRAANQERAQDEAEEPSAMVAWAFDAFETVESSIKSALHQYAKSSLVGRWSLAQCGIGPVLSAGLLAHIDISKAPTPGHIYSFAGLVPGQREKWKKGVKRPWNADLKVLTWKISDSFVKQKGREACFYGHRYAERKAVELDRNERGENAAFAAQCLERKKFTKKEVIATYESGKLPLGHIEARARRWTSKLFLSHWWQVAYEVHHGTTPPPAPYPIAHQGHAHMIHPPLWPLVE